MPASCQRGRFALADDQVIQQPYVDQLEGGLQPPGYALVGLARFGDPGGVIVGKNDGGGIDRQRLLDDLARIDGGAVYGAAKQLLETQDPVTVVEVQAAKALVVEMSTGAPSGKPRYQPDCESSRRWEAIRRSSGERVPVRPARRSTSRCRCHDTRAARGYRRAAGHAGCRNARAGESAARDATVPPPRAPITALSSCTSVCRLSLSCLIAR